MTRTESERRDARHARRDRSCLLPSARLRRRAAVGILFTACTTLASIWSTVGTDSLLARLTDVEMANASIEADGVIRLAPALSEADVVPTEEGAVWSVCRDRAGNLYLATGHMTRLFRSRDLGSRASAIHDGGAGEILALAPDAQGNVWFGTTPSAEVFRVSAGAQPESVVDLDENYVFALLPAPDNSMLCATGTAGRLYRLAQGVAARELFAAPQSHLTVLTWLEPGRELLCGTSPDGLVYRLTFRPGFERPEAAVLYDTPLDEVRAITTGPGGRVFIAANPATDGEEAGDPAAVYCLDRDGILRWEWTCPDSMIFGLLVRDNRVWVATGSNGTVYALDTAGRASVVARLEEPQVLCLVPDRSSVLLGTANSGRLYTLAAGYADSGHVFAPPHDCGNPSRFGRLDYRAAVPLGTELAVDLRSGNSEKPDSTWSAWSGSPPPGRFVQWRCRMTSRFPNLTPELRRVDLYYAAANRAPSVASLTISAPSEAEARRGTSKPVREVSWEATDPESDSLVYRLYIRPERTAPWRLLGEHDIAATTFDLDVHTLPDGWYELRLVASDRTDRPGGVALSAERTSAAFVVDNTAPAIRDLAVTGSRLTFAVADALTSVAGCRVSVDSGEWLPTEPVDGLFDSLAERFSVPLTLGPGEHTVAVWASDAQGNVGAARTSVR